MAHTRLLAQDDVHLSLGLEKEFHADKLRELLPRLRAAIKKVTGKDLAVEIIVGAPEHVPATENLVEVEERKVVDDREKRRLEAIEHPARKALDDRFGGTWKDPIVDDVEKT
jgi:hypothetical protein